MNEVVEQSSRCQSLEAMVRGAEENDLRVITFHFNEVFNGDRFTETGLIPNIRKQINVFTQHLASSNLNLIIYIATEIAENKYLGFEFSRVSQKFEPNQKLKSLSSNELQTVTMTNQPISNTFESFLLQSFLMGIKLEIHTPPLQI